MDEKYSELLIEINNNLKLILSALESGQEGGGGNYKIVLYSVPIVGIIFGSTLLFFIFFWWAHLPDDHVTGPQPKTPNLALRHIDIVRAR